MFALECLDSGSLSAKVKQKMRRQIPPSLYLLPTGAALQKLSSAQSKHQRFRESDPVIVRLRVVAHGWNPK